jgi:hypothetical protein
MRASLVWGIAMPKILLHVTQGSREISLAEGMVVRIDPVAESNIFKIIVFSCLINDFLRIRYVNIYIYIYIYIYI